MLTRRLIPCLDVKDGRVVKGTQFLDLRDVAEPAELAARHAAAGADEIVLLDISATRENRAALIDTVRSVARELFIPFTAGGGVGSLSAAGALFDAGADKVSINSAAVRRPELITEIAQRFGSQAVIVAIDAAVDARGQGEVTVAGGSQRTGKKVLDWAREAESRGAGEILLTAMQQDGMQSGFDCALTRSVSRAVSIPVIASGGAGNTSHFVEVFTSGEADAALAASIFHFGQVSIAEVKQAMSMADIPVRWQC